MRLFVASMLPPSDQAVYDEFARGLARDFGRLIRPVPPQSAHVTHAFLGDAEASLLGEIERTLRRAVDGQSPVDVEIGAPEVLTSGAGPRALIAPVTTGKRDLYELAMAIVFALRRLPGFTALALPRPPHVTVARFRKGASRADGRRVADHLARTPVAPHRWLVTSIELMHSQLTPEGPVYKPLVHIDLA